MSGRGIGSGKEQGTAVTAPRTKSASAIAQCEIQDALTQSKMENGTPNSESAEAADTRLVASSTRNSDTVEGASLPADERALELEATQDESVSCASLSNVHLSEGESPTTSPPPVPPPRRFVPSDGGERVQISTDNSVENLEPKGRHPMAVRVSEIERSRWQPSKVH